MAAPPTDAALAERDAGEPVSLSRALTRFMTAVRDALRGGLTYSQNHLALVKTFDVTPTSPWTNLYLDVSDLNAVPTGCQLLLAYQSASPDTVLSGVYVDWRPTTYQGKQSVKLKGISGLTAGTRYTVRLLITGGDDA